MIHVTEYLVATIISLWPTTLSPQIDVRSPPLISGDIEEGWPFPIAVAGDVEEVRRKYVPAPEWQDHEEQLHPCFLNRNIRCDEAFEVPSERAAPSRRSQMPKYYYDRADDGVYESDMPHYGGGGYGYGWRSR